MRRSPLKGLLLFGQSPWLDFIQRSLLESGELQELIDDWGIRGVTTNPTIFEKAIVQSRDYEEQIALLAQAGNGAAEIYESLVLEDVRCATDTLRSIFLESSGVDGYVSLEVSPHLVNDAAGTVEEARRFWKRLERPNAMIKVPATIGGLRSIRQLISEGINVNVTLLFSVSSYHDVVDAYLSGLEDATDAGRPIDSVASVASFFLSRIDSMVDPMIEAIVAQGAPCSDRARLLLGEVAIASARYAYYVYQDILRSDRYLRLAELGAQPQRLLWASTGTKNPAYSDVKYVEPLVGAGTVNTMPLETLAAYDDHGEPNDRLGRYAKKADDIAEELAEIGIDLDAITDRLLMDGIAKFKEPFDRTHRLLESKVA